MVSAAYAVCGGERVRLSYYLKALACNVKRMVEARLLEMDKTLARPTPWSLLPSLHESAGAVANPIIPTRTA